MNDDLKHEKPEGNARKQILTALLATVPTFTYGIQIGWLSPMKKMLTLQETSTAPISSPITDNDISWMAAALPLAAICGIPFFSYASDKFGRKLCIVLVSLLSCMSWILKLSIIRSSALIAARAIAGLAAGGCFIVVPVYIKEIAEDSWRGALASLVMTVCKVGVIFVYGVGMVSSYNVNQSVYLALAAVHAFVFLFMPESPNFLLKIGKEKRAAKTISWLRNVKISSKIVSDEIIKMKEEQRRFEEMPRVTLLSVVRDRVTFSALRMTLTLMGVQTLSGCFALMNYASAVFAAAGASWSPDALAIVMASLQLAGSFFTTMSIERFGRKIPLCASAGVVCACMWWVGGGAGGGAAALGGALLAYGAGLAPVPFVLMAEVFAFRLRARMAGVSMAFSFLCSSMTVLFYAPIAQQFGEHVVFFVFGAVAAFGVLYTIIWVPETKGKNLEEIQKFWKKEPPPEFV